MEILYIPLNIPIVLRAFTGNTLENQFFWRNAVCHNPNLLAFEHLLIHFTDEKKFVIQSKWDKRYLQVQNNGKFIFGSHNQSLAEKFNIETNSEGKFYFISSDSGYSMQCRADGYVYSAEKDGTPNDAWNIIYPNNTNGVTYDGIKQASFIAGGIILVPGAGLLSEVLLPGAIFTVGTIITETIIPGTIYACTSMATTMCTSYTVATTVIPVAITTSNLVLTPMGTAVGAATLGVKAYYTIKARIMPFVVWKK